MLYLKKFFMPFCLFDLHGLDCTTWQLYDNTILLVRVNILKVLITAHGILHWLPCMEFYDSFGETMRASLCDYYNEIEFNVMLIDCAEKYRSIAVVLAFWVVSIVNPLME